MSLGWGPLTSRRERMRGCARVETTALSGGAEGDEPRRRAAGARAPALAGARAPAQDEAASIFSMFLVTTSIVRPNSSVGLNSTTSVPA